MKAIWKGALSFGLVHIPVRLYPAVSRSDVHFRLLHKKCRSPVRFKRFCPVCEQDLSEGEIIRGYEYQKGSFVLLEEEELEETKTGPQNIQIKSFHALSEIDPIYFDKTYYLEATEGGGKAYRLLQVALAEKGRVALALFQLRTKTSLCVVRPLADILSLTTLLYADEIRSARELASYKRDVAEEELAMAHALIDNLTAPFQPEKYENEERRALEKIIERKLAGQEVVQAPAEPSGKVIDLVEALRASVEATKKPARKKA